jgi:positive regulator of sigma E activity
MQAKDGDGKMKQTAKVIRVNGGKATIEVRRESACSSCARREACFGCSDNIVTSEASNDAGSKPGDIVTVESSSARVLGYAAAVFVLPVTAGIFCFLILSGFLTGLLLYLVPALLFASLFAAACVILEKKIKKYPDIRITAVVGHTEPDDEEGKNR